MPFIVRLVRAGLATVHTERVVAGGRRLEVARVRITDGGRRALAAPRRPAR
jgi:acyl-coenzyme A thioesterase PaaI-like protein